MMWLILLTALVAFVGATEKSNARPFSWVRESRAYQGGRRRVVDAGSALRGRPVVYLNGQRTRVEDLPAGKAAAPRAPRQERRRAISYAPPPITPPAATAAAASNGAPAGGAGITVDFFQGLLALVNAPYEGPQDALRQLRALGEGGRQWNNGLIRLHQRMSDPGDMRIDPFVSEHVVKAAALGQAMVLELVEADAAMTALLNMTLAEITERGLQVPNTK